MDYYCIEWDGQMGMLLYMGFVVGVMSFVVLLFLLWFYVGECVYVDWFLLVIVGCF